MENKDKNYTLEVYTVKAGWVLVKDVDTVKEGRKEALLNRKHWTRTMKYRIIQEIIELNL